MTVTIYHNPACGTSRNTLAMIRKSGEEPRVIEYLKTPPSLTELTDLISAMGLLLAIYCDGRERPCAVLLRPCSISFPTPR